MAADSSDDVAPSIWRWSSGPAQPSLVATLPAQDYTDSSGQALRFLRVLGSAQFLVANQVTVWLVDAPTAAATTATPIYQLTSELYSDAIQELVVAGDNLVVHSQGNDTHATFVSLTAPYATFELDDAINQLSTPPGCDTGAHSFVGTGALYGSTYVYQASSGVFAVTVTTAAVPRARFSSAA